MTVGIVEQRLVDRVTRHQILGLLGEGVRLLAEGGCLGLRQQGADLPQHARVVSESVTGVRRANRGGGTWPLRALRRRSVPRRRWRNQWGQPVQRLELADQPEHIRPAVPRSDALAELPAGDEPPLAGATGIRTCCETARLQRLQLGQPVVGGPVAEPFPPRLFQDDRDHQGNTPGALMPPHDVNEIQRLPAVLPQQADQLQQSVGREPVGPKGVVGIDDRSRHQGLDDLVGIRLVGVLPEGQYRSPRQQLRDLDLRIHLLGPLPRAGIVRHPIRDTLVSMVCPPVIRRMAGMGGSRTGQVLGAVRAVPALRWPAMGRRNRSARRSSATLRGPSLLIVLPHVGSMSMMSDSPDRRGGSATGSRTGAG